MDKPLPIPELDVKKAKVPQVIELQDPPTVLQPAKVTFIFTHWFMALILGVALGAGALAYYYFKQDLDKSLAVVGAIIAIAGIWLSYSRLGMANEHQIASLGQRERHQADASYFQIASMTQRERHQDQTIEFYRKKASLDVITEWYGKELMQKSFIARNFRISYTDDLGQINLDKIGDAIRKAEIEEIALLRNGNVKDEERKLADIPEEKLLIRKNIIPILNYFEKISAGILRDTLDEVVLKDYFYDAFIVYEEAFRPLINMRRTNLHNGTPRAFDSYLEVVRRWKGFPPKI